jgi:hypothetical protein
MPQERRDAPCRDVVHGHIGKPPYAPYPRQACTPRRRSDRWSLRCAGGSSPVASVASGPCQVASIHRPAHRLWCAIGRRSGARRRPSRVLSTRARVVVGTSLAANRPLAPTAPAYPCAHAHPPPSLVVRHWHRRCEPPSRRRPHLHKRPNSSLCITKAPRIACRSSPAARSPEPKLPRPPPDRHRRARPSVDPPRPVTCLAPSLGHMEASGVAHY